MKNDVLLGIVGGGSMATALAKLLQENGFHVLWYIRRREVIEYIKKFGHNPDYLSSVEFDPSKISFYHNIQDIFEVSDYLFLAIPAAFLNKALSEVDEELICEKFIISTIKGIIPDFNLIPSEYFAQFFNFSLENYAILAGPSHAEELVMNKISYLTIGSTNIKFAEFLKNILSSNNIKFSLSTDVKGIEYAATLKNIYAIAAGISDGLNYGDNFISVLIIHAIKEMQFFLNSINHFNRDINSSVYAGDLLVTAYSQFSRNRAFGRLIGKGYSVNYSRIEMKQVAEGYYATKCMKEIADKMNIHMPILETVYRILYKELSPSREMKKLSEILT
ncbi:MAG: NAD(P)-binding domain-containing protein [Bacteroidales bacterium]|nr:NAD(P)-binding domain-containing protein [Bacteroidales bacterium]